MKKLLLLASLFFFAGIYSAQAQCQGAKAAAKTTEVKTCQKSTEAAKAASIDASIEKRIDENTGEATYYRKEVSQAGKAIYTQVEYCTRSQRFVNVSPSAEAAAAKKACCSKGSAEKTAAGKACCSKGADKQGCQGASKSNSNSKAG